MEQERIMYKIFGGKGIEDKTYFTTSDWGGTIPVRVYLPKEPNEKVIEEVKDFILNELDSHDDYTKFCKAIQILKHKKDCGIKAEFVDGGKLK